jgi:dCTP diphosphatase
VENIKFKLRKFAKDRDWDQFHSPKNLSMALSSEVGELLDLLQWKSEKNSELDKLSEKELEYIQEELADIFLYLIRIADKLDVDLIEVAEKKIIKNGIKYPVEISKGNSTKYNRRDE